MIITKKDGWDTAIIIGSGPSLTKQQIEHIRRSRSKGSKVIAVNDNYKLAPWSNVLFSADLIWWKHNYRYINRNLPNCELWTISGVRAPLFRTIGKSYSDINEADFERLPGLGKDGKVHHGGNSGYIAVNLAWLFGVKKIILVGFDHQHTNGKKHWFGDHDPTLFKKNADGIERWQDSFEQLAIDILETGVDLVNCSIETAIQSCRRSKVEVEV